MKAKKSTRNKLVKKWSYHKPREKFQEALGSKQRGTGIYVLYKGKKSKPVYIGKSTSSMRKRIKEHNVDHLHGKWDNFSFYQILKKKYVGDVERLLLQYYRPKENRQGGKFRSRLRIK